MNPWEEPGANVVYVLEQLATNFKVLLIVTSWRFFLVLLLSCNFLPLQSHHMSMKAFQITGNSIVCQTVRSG